MKIIHVNNHIIRYNKKHGTSLPPVRVQEGSKHSRYCQEVKINGPSQVIYRPDAPLACGARLWIETEAFVELIGETPYSNIREQLEKFKP